MIGIIVTGHGKFAEGLLSALNVIVGISEKIIAVNFSEGDSTEILDKNLLEAINNLNCEEIAILADIAGGSPFRQSVLLSKQVSQKIKVFSGTNLPFLIQAIFNRDIDFKDIEDKWLSDEVQVVSFKDKKKVECSQEGGI